MKRSTAHSSARRTASRRPVIMIIATAMFTLMCQVIFFPYLLWKNYVDPYLTGKWYRFYLDRTDRNIGWITLKEQLMLKGARVGIAGTGGMGGLLAAILARLGVGTIIIADNDTFERSNLNRQFGAFLGTLGVNKAKATARMIRAMLGESIHIIVFDKGVTEDTVEEFVSLCDVIADEVEFWALGSRILLHVTARKHGITLFNSPTVGHRVYAYRYTHQSMPVEELLEVGYTEGIRLERKIQSRTATKEEVEFVMKVMLRLAAPEVPEYSVATAAYSTKGELVRRLREENKA